MDKASIESIYVGADGRRYLQQRSASVSEYSQSLRAALFEQISAPDTILLDFGCGSGGVVTRLAAARRIGIEIGAEATEMARNAGVAVFASLCELQDDLVDVAISCHALEHVDDPLHVLRELKRVVKPGGRIRLVVPCETPLQNVERSWRPNRDRHLFTWTPLLFGNLADRAGFVSIRTRLEPMPTRSRSVLWLRRVPRLARFAHFLLAFRRNNLNVVLDAAVPPGAP